MASLSRPDKNVQPTREHGTREVVPPDGRLESSPRDPPQERRKSCENGQRIVEALLQLGFILDDNSQREIIQGKDFVQLKDGPFDLDLVFAPDGIESFTEAKARAVQEGIFPVANLRDIIASKRASGRMKDRLDLHLLELFRIEFESRCS